MYEPKIIIAGIVTDNRPTTVKSPRSSCALITRTQRVRVLYENGDPEDLFQVMPNEVESFSEADFLGRTREEALTLQEAMTYTANLLGGLQVA